MASHDTRTRPLYDLGGVGWLGGSLTGAIARRAAATVRDDRDRAHLLSGAVSLRALRGLAKHQNGVTSNAVAGIVPTDAALGATATRGITEAEMIDEQRYSTEARSARGATKHPWATPHDVSAAHRQLHYPLPRSAGAIIVLGVQRGEQQHPTQAVSSGAVNSQTRTLLESSASSWRPRP